MMIKQTSGFPITYPNYIAIVLFLQFPETTHLRVGVLSSLHCNAECNGSEYMLKLLGYQATPEVCLLGANGQLLWLPP